MTGPTGPTDPPGATDPPAANGAAGPPGPTVRQLGTPAASALADLAATFEELQTVLGCCERLVATPPPDELVAEALWTTALLSYARCFAPGARGVGLTVEDVKNTKLEGALEDWHGLLLRMRDHYADPTVDPRERFSVGVSRNSDGTPAGIAVTGLRQPLPDDVTVRQTGTLAYGLLRVVDERIGAQQRRVFAAAGAMSQAELDRLPEVDVDVPV
ncbi:MAG TPA: hypothetical protein VNC80_03375 [Mycobacteriales bacterium]|nr:hypothetical protein [Mycobacteriales bacterium]HVE29085.1 hypothetical protein [Mycobacteriales bacterium]